MRNRCRNPKCDENLIDYVVARIEMWPAGFSRKKRRLGFCVISNNMTGDKGPGGRRNGTVRDFPRASKDAWSLLRRVLEEAGK